MTVLNAISEWLSPEPWSTLWEIQVGVSWVASIAILVAAGKKAVKELDNPDGDV